MSTTTKPLTDIDFHIFLWCQNIFPHTLCDKFKILVKDVMLVLPILVRSGWLKKKKGVLADCLLLFSFVLSIFHIDLGGQNPHKF